MTTSSPLSPSGRHCIRCSASLTTISSDSKGPGRRQYKTLYAIGVRSIKQSATEPLPILYGGGIFILYLVRKVWLSLIGLQLHQKKKNEVFRGCLPLNKSDSRHGQKEMPKWYRECLPLIKSVWELRGLEQGTKIK